MNEDNIFWYMHNCPHCGKSVTGFYTEPYVNATFTCGCGHDLVIVDVGHNKHDMVCEDMNDHLRAAYEDYFNNR